MGGSDAARLFLDRAALHPGFALTDAAAPALARLCHRLDGIPLALELAAARTRTLSVEQIHDRLDQRFRLLTGGSRTALPRQQTLQGLMDWSYELLTAAERRLLARLSVFAAAGPWPPPKPSARRTGSEEWEVLDGLTGLVDKSLAAFDSRATACSKPSACTPATDWTRRRTRTRRASATRTSSWRWPRKRSPESVRAGHGPVPEPAGDGV